jgi:hypothetical protein
VDWLKVLAPLCLSTVPIAKSLSSHISLKGSDQSGITKIGEFINFSFNKLNANKHFSSKLKGASFSSRVVRGGFEILEKS